MITALQETAPPVRLDRAVAEDASLSVLDGAAGSDASAIPSEPPAATLEQILAIVVRAYPNGGNCLEAAVRTAIKLGWATRHHLEAVS